MKRKFLTIAVVLGSIASTVYAQEDPKKPEQPTVEAVKNPVEEFVQARGNALGKKMELFQNENKEKMNKLEQDFATTCKTREDLQTKEACKTIQKDMIDIALEMAKLFIGALEDGVNGLNEMKQKLQ